VAFVEMLDKLFVRVRSWLHIDPAAASTVSASGLAGVPGPAIAGPSLGGANRSAQKHAASAAQDVAPTPPPLPAEAFSLVMEAQPESGMVITESGIIIIDPNAVEASAKATSSSSDSWALPNGPAQPVQQMNARADSYGDWDTVLARARAQLSTPDKSKK
jgi:hypothetical protein